MHAVRATVSRGRPARVRIVWTSEAEASTREAAEGMRLTRWMAGPVGIFSLVRLQQAPILLLLESARSKHAQQAENSPR